MGNQSPVGGSILARAWVRIPYLPPPSSFAFGARGSPSPITSRPGTRAIGAYRNQVRHVHPRLPGFIGYGKAIPGFGPATADASRDHVTDHWRSPADLPVAAWETAAVSGPRTTRPRSRCNRWQWARLMGGPGQISPGSAREGTTDTRTVWKECHALPGKP